MRGADLRLKLHPLFLLAGVLSAFTGDLLLFLAAALAAIEHECAHAFAARRLGFRLDRIVLMPYGAVISGDLSEISPKEELYVCAAGPLANGLTALGFAALWWLYPETYPYTDAAAFVSLSLFLVNLLPAYPLDGGRALFVLLRPLGRRRAQLLCRAVSIAVAAGVFALFVLSCFSEPNPSALFFSVFLAAGCFGGGQYGRLTFARKTFRRGVEERRVALSADATASEAMRYLREDKYLVFDLFDGGEFFSELPEEELLTALEAGRYSEKLREFVRTY